MVIILKKEKILANILMYIFQIMCSIDEAQ